MKFVVYHEFGVKTFINQVLKTLNLSFLFVELADRTLSVGFADAADYLLIWCQYCDYLKRRIDWDKGNICAIF